MKKLAKSVPAEFKLTSRARVVPKDQRTQMPPEAFEDRNTKVRVTIHLDLDVLNFFKGLAKKPGAQPYQTQINATLRQVIEDAGHTKGQDPCSNLRQAKGLIDAAMRQLS
jgi:uncharacterized protein (DUF4415 family)